MLVLANLQCSQAFVLYCTDLHETQKVNLSVTLSPKSHEHRNLLIQEVSKKILCDQVNKRVQ